MNPLENRLILHPFLCGEFGYPDLPAMLDRLRGVPAGFTANGESEYARALYLNPARATITPNQLADYDKEIAQLSRDLGMTIEQGRGWKPHQYLALLFSEHYLCRYFADPEQLKDALNTAKLQRRLTAEIPEYTLADLRTIAIQSATGSGKTLVMHGHILQYRRLARAAGNPPNNVVLVTPNEQLSAQHARELRASNLQARLFSSESGSTLLDVVEIIDLNKLAERKGVKRVAVSDFGDNNLVLVDEGHLGASGKVWRKRRMELARSGFTFEYSATFNQILSGDNDMRDTYGKCLLFDYPYRMFHADGYGKDYAISNLPQGAEDDNSTMYLLGCLLSFYRQCRIWREGHANWTAFNLTRPLWVFLGKTVIGNTNVSQEARSDVVRILDFLGWFLAHRDQICPMVAQLLAGQSGLTNGSGNDFFANRFDDLKGETIEALEALYDDICQTLFHGPGALHIRYLTQGEGELHLCTADNPPFGVVNIGDSAKLYGLLGKREHNFVLERDAGFTQRLFAHVDQDHSRVNIVIGARRFIAGWNSWRVSTMGLMHVGVGEGPEIIQMFGRGVRLKGWNMSLKRHRESGAPLPVNSDRLAELETLRIFGLRARYMETFRDLLQKDGISIERETISLPVTWNFAKQNLKIIRIQEGLHYECSDDRPVLPDPGDSNSPMVEMDLYSQLQSVQSSDDEEIGHTRKDPVNLKAHHIALLNRERIYDKLLARKRRQNWHNLTVGLSTLDALLNQNDWYSLYLPPQQQNIRTYADVLKLEDILVEMIAEYMSSFWQRQRARWESKHIEVTTLKESDPNNVNEYQLSVDATKIQLIEDIHTLSTSLQDMKIRSLKLGSLMVEAHAYKPLLYATGQGDVKVQPVPLNNDEKCVVERLARMASNGEPCLQGRELFLIRNLSRGRGLSFFDEHAYYPDFIVWLTNDKGQHIVFIDPKGLVRFGPRERKKVNLHTEIKEIQEHVCQKDPSLRLHAYVLSITPPENIGDVPRLQREWEEMGVYFLQDPGWPQQLLADVMASP